MLDYLSLPVEMQNGKTILEDHLALSYKNKCSLTIQSSITLFNIYPNELNTYVYKKTCVCVFIVALLIIAKPWK